MEREKEDTYVREQSFQSAHAQLVWGKFKRPLFNKFGRNVLPQLQIDYAFQDWEKSTVYFDCLFFFLETKKNSFNLKNIMNRYISCFEFHTDTAYTWTLKSIMSLKWRNERRPFLQFYKGVKNHENWCIAVGR